MAILPHKLNPLKGSIRRGPFLTVYVCLTVLLICIAGFFHMAIQAGERDPGPFTVWFYTATITYMAIMSVFNARRLHDGGYSGFIAYFVFAVAGIETLLLQSGYTLWFFTGFSFLLVFVPHYEDLARHTDVFK